MNSVNALVINGAGINCESETAYALAKAGANVEIIHINDILKGNLLQGDRGVLDKYQILVLPGGFSYGDEVGAGKILGDNLKNAIGESLHQFIADDYLVLGICNGAQTIVKMGYAPGSDGVQTATITNNESGGFVDRWVDMTFDEKSPAFKIYTNGIESMALPIRHGEGRFVFGDGVYDEVVENHQVVARYVDDGLIENLHYSLKPKDDTAILCNKEGNVFVTMPHFEGDGVIGQSPHWSMIREKLRRSGELINAKAPGPGQKLFDNMVNYSIEKLV